MLNSVISGACTVPADPGNSCTWGQQSDAVQDIKADGLMTEKDASLLRKPKLGVPLWQVSRSAVHFGARILRVGEKVDLGVQVIVKQYGA